MFDRQKYLRLLVETLPERETRVKTGKRVVGIDTTASGVVVKLDDGTVETGSIVIGADGIWSVVRQEMEKQLGEKVFDPEYCGFTGVYGHGDAVEGLETFNGYERHDGLDGMGLQVFTSPTKTFWGCYMRAEDESEEGRKFKRYSEEDAEAAIQKWLNVPVYGKVTFGDVWKARELWGMTQAHAGRAKLWHWDRIVLVGDAVHKVSDSNPACSHYLPSRTNTKRQVTPNIGAGAAVGSESAACLGNHLHALLQSQSQPDTESLSKAFAAYQAQRMEVSTAWVTIARTNLDSILWRNWWHRFKTFEMTNLLGPLRLQRLFSGPMIAKAVRLDYVPFDNEQTGTVPWRFGEVEEDPPRGIAYGWWFLGLGVLSAGALLWVQRSGLSIT